ncbi:MAG: hypothetical protein ABR923_03865 [Terracidiphilus sp.]|jgi:hypothetical protein
MTPNFAVIGVHTPDWRMPRLWVPLFLLWIPLILLSPLIFLVIIAVCLCGHINPFRAIAICWAILCSLPGTHIRVTEASHTEVLVQIL